jgi:hypothetical protein
MKTMRHVCGFTGLVSCVLLAFGGTAALAAKKPEVTAGAKSSSFYKGPQLFYPHADETEARYVIERLGPVGIGLDLLQPAFTMQISNVEPGSPAAATGKLKKGQIIESINGQVLKDIDPRIQLGNLITEVEAKDGLVKLMVKDSPKGKAEEVVVKIPVLGAYSETWPLNCPKSDKIVRNFAGFLAKANHAGYGAALFLLSTGDEKDLEVVRGWFHDMKPGAFGGIPWDIGYNGPAVCEYYLRTGDDTVLPAIKAAVDYLYKTMYNGAWASRGGAPFAYMAGGHLNAAGVHCVTFLMLAKECGVEVPEDMLLPALRHFLRFAGHGNVSYGDGLPEGGMVDNGKTGGLAFGLAAAASLTPEGENSVYARARDISATKSFYSTSWLFHGHTGGGIGEIWRGAAMGLVKDKRPAQYRSFMDERRWMYELSRTHDGAFGIVGAYWNANGRYNVTGHNGGRSWGNLFPLVYTIPRKQLRIYGAPPTKYSKTYLLPKRPWGTAADDAFYSLEPGESLPGKRQDISQERLATDASYAIGERYNAPDASDDVLRMYARHIDQGIRDGACGVIARKGRVDLILELLKDKDPRARFGGAQAIVGGGKNAGLAPELVTDEMIGLLAGMVNNPEESWWCVQGALVALGRAKPDQLAPHLDRLLVWLKHDDWWLQKAAATALTPLATDPRFYAKVLPAIGAFIARNQHVPAASPVSGIVSKLAEADPKVLALAVQTLTRAYEDYPAKLQAPGGQNLDEGAAFMLNALARNLSEAPSGFDELYRVAQKRFPNNPLPHRELFLAADPSRFGADLQQAFKPLLKDELIPAYWVVNRQALEKEIEARQPDRMVDGLVALYQKAGLGDYNWSLWGPARDKIEWQYFSYDPSEAMPWAPGFRYRKVSWPVGAENWFTAGFDPVKAGWKTGLAPFANNDGKLAPLGSCIGNYCGCGEAPHTFWEKEVLLMRSQIAVPAMRDGHAYRLLVGGRSHVFGGDGSDVWIDGKYKAARKDGPSLSGVDKREGGRPVGFTLGADFRPLFDDGKVLLAATGFLRRNAKTGVLGNTQSFWFEEMKLPVISPGEILKAAQSVQLKCAAWQALQDPEVPDRDMEKGKFQYDGKFSANPKLLGSWELVEQVAAVEAFVPGKPVAAEPKAKPAKKGSAPALARITFQDGGLTGDRWRVWSGDTMMDLGNTQALKMMLKTVGGTEYLFIEAGGFDSAKGMDWTSPWLVFKHSDK